MKLKRKLEKCLVLLLVLSILTGTAGKSCIQAKEEEKRAGRATGLKSSIPSTTNGTAATMQP